MMDAHDSGSRSPQGADAGAPIARRRWESELPREEIARLLGERRLEDLLMRLGAARARFPRDLEVLRSIRVLEDHLGVQLPKK